MAKDKVSTNTVDQETQDLVRAGRQPEPKAPATGEKFMKQLDRFASSSRDGKSGV